METDMQKQQRVELQRKARIIDYKRRSHIPELAMVDYRLEQFVRLPGNEQAFKLACYYIGRNDDLLPFTEKQWDDYERHHFITFAGLPGRGKTRLAIGMGIHILENDAVRVKYWQVEELLNALRSGFDDNKLQPDSPSSYDLTIGNTKDVNTLILDDLGAEYSSAWAGAQLDELIDYRYINQLDTIFTTNLSLGRLPPRIGSRLAEGEVGILEGDDFRRMIRAKREKARGMI